MMLEQDYLKDSTVYNFSDDRSRQLNEYSANLIRELILPELTKIVNSDKRYAQLRQVYHSLILAQWFKSHFNSGTSQKYGRLIDSRNLERLVSRSDWSARTYFEQYKKSFQKGEYNIKEAHFGITGKSMRSYFSGGIKMSSSSVVVSFEATGAVAQRLRGELLKTGDFVAFSPETGIVSSSKVTENRSQSSSPITSEDFREGILPQLLSMSIDDHDEAMYQILKRIAPLEAKKAEKRTTPQEEKELEELQKALDGIINSINADPQLSSEIREGTVYDVEKGIPEELRQGYLNLAREHLMSGKVAFLLLFGGEATRLGLGAMYPIDLVKVARYLLRYPSNLTREEIKKIEGALQDYCERERKKEVQELKLAGHRASEARSRDEIRAELVASIKGAYDKYEVEFGSSSEDDKDRVLPTMGQRHNYAFRDAFLALFSPEALQKTKIIVVPNESIEQEVLEDFARPDHAFYGFNPSNVFFMDAPRMKPFTLSRVTDRHGNTSLAVVTNNAVSGDKRFAPNHGYVMFQMTFENEAYNTTDGSGRDRLGMSLIDKLAKDGVELIITRRVNDFELWDTNPENVLGIKQLAAILYQMDQGVEMVSEVLENDGEQKGGLLLWRPGMDVNDSYLFEGLSGGTQAWKDAVEATNRRVTQLTKWRRSGVYYNRFNQALSVTAIRQRFARSDYKDLMFSIPIRSRPGGFQFELPFGEFSRIFDHRGITRVGAKVKDFKAFNNLPDVLEQAGEQSRTLAQNRARGQWSSMKTSSPVSNGPSSSSPIAVPQTRISSSAKEKDLGGIDFSSIPIMAQFSPAAFLPVPPRLLSASERDQTRFDFEAMIQSKIMPSSERVWEYAYSASQDFSSEWDVLKATTCLVNILRLEEEMGIPSQPGTMQGLVVLESRGSLARTFTGTDED